VTSPPKGPGGAGEVLPPGCQLAHLESYLTENGTLTKLGFAFVFLAVLTFELRALHLGALLLEPYPQPSFVLLLFVR
jgi:hypothetical protein